MSQVRTLERIPLGIGSPLRRSPTPELEADEDEGILIGQGSMIGQDRVSGQGVMIGLPPRELVEEFKASTGETVRIWRERGVRPARPNRGR